MMMITSDQVINHKLIVNIKKSLIKFNFNSNITIFHTNPTGRILVQTFKKSSDQQINMYCWLLDDMLLLEKVKYFWLNYCHI